MEQQATNASGLSPRSGAQKGIRSGSTRLVMVLFLFALLAAAEYSLTTWLSSSINHSDSGLSISEKNLIISFRGFKTSYFSDDRKIKVSAESLEVVPRKYMVFSIHPLNEIIINDFSIEYFMQPQDQTLFRLSTIQDAFFPPENGQSAFSGMFNLKPGVITRGVIRNFSLTIYSGDEIRTTVRSEKAEFNFKEDKIILDTVRIEQHDFKRVTNSREAILRNSNGTVYIHGEYVINHSGGALHGRGMKIKL